MTPLDLTQFSTRTRNCLRVTDGLHFVEQVAEMSDEELLVIPNLGKYCLAEIRAVIPQKDSMQYMRDILKGLKEQVAKMEALLESHSS